MKTQGRELCQHTGADARLTCRQGLEWRRENEQEVIGIRGTNKTCLTVGWNPANIVLATRELVNIVGHLTASEAHGSCFTDEKLRLRKVKYLTQDWKRKQRAQPSWSDSKAGALVNFLPKLPRLSVCLGTLIPSPQEKTATWLSCSCSPSQVIPLSQS